MYCVTFLSLQGLPDGYEQCSLEENLTCLIVNVNHVTDVLANIRTPDTIVPNQQLAKEPGAFACTVFLYFVCNKVRLNCTFVLL